MAHADLQPAVTKLAAARTRLQLAKATAKHLSGVQRRPQRIKRHFQHSNMHRFDGPLEFNT